MSHDHNKARIRLERLSAALICDVDHLSDSELAEEVISALGSSANLASQTSKLIEMAIAESGKRRLLTARQNFEAHRSQKQLNVLRLTVEAKEALLKRVANQNRAIDQKFTLAAREGKDSQADIDSLLEDLVELGVIDDEGNIR